ncbi:MAG: hypothetical protein JO297_19330 [Nitrososphaeraceae archaeon]|nr:hypothetical protein [Nitrososphaeraceae archaeon]
MPSKTQQFENLTIALFLVILIVVFLVIAYLPIGNIGSGLLSTSSTPPVADTGHPYGTDQVVYEGSTVTLDGSASFSHDPSSNPITTFTWKQTAGSPAVMLTGANTARATFTAPSNLKNNTVLEFQLTVTDKHGLSNIGYTRVTVRHTVSPVDTHEEKIVPPTKGVYLSALTDFGGLEDQINIKNISHFEQLVGKNITWAYFSNNWNESGIHFPTQAVKAIHQLGVVPFLRIMPRTSDYVEGSKDKKYSQDGIIRGEFDDGQDGIKQWMIDAKKAGVPIMVDIEPEMNGHWFPWSGVINNPDGPQKYVQVYRHIVDLSRQMNVTNITWAFHIYPPQDTDWLSNQSWNNVANYYPGDNYVDWIGISAYGSFEKGTDWESFISIMNQAYPVMANLGNKTKPIAVFEMATMEDPAMGNKSQWIHDALTSIENGIYPRIKAISYWNEAWDDCPENCHNGELHKIVNLRVDSDPQSLDVYKKMIASPFFVSKAIIQKR